MATIKTKLLENLPSKTRNLMIISRFGLMIGAFSFIFITLLLLFTTKLTTPFIFYPSLAFSTVKSLNNFTVGGNFSGEGKNKNTHFVDIEFGMKNVSFIVQELSNFTEDGNFLEDKQTHVVNFEFGNFTEEGKMVNFEFGVKNVSFVGQELGNVSVGNFSEEGKMVNFEFAVKNVSVGNFSEEGKMVNFEFAVKNVSFNGNFSEEGKKVKNVSFLGKESRNNNNISDSGGNFFEGKKVKNVSLKLNFNGECDIFDGKWVKDELLPHYPPGSCNFIDIDFNCHKNGRPDQGFYKWRWQPNFCSIPRLNATDFLEKMRGRRLVFVGDSLNRNMWESLVCILRHSLKNKTRVHEISGRSEFKKQGFYAFRFEDYNCTIDYVRAPFLVRESTFQGQNGTFPTLRLDLMDETTKMYHDADILIFNTGHWWTHEKTSRGEDYYQVGNHVYPRLEALQAYRKALRTWARWVDKHVNVTKTLVFFRGYSGTHFRGGQWNSGGQCHKETEPIFNETYLGEYPPKMKVLERVMRRMQTPVMYLNVSRLTDYRKDAHPSVYRKSYDTPKELTEAEKSQDCSHWCLPGVPDIWNELLYASLLKLRWKHPISHV